MTVDADCRLYRLVPQVLLNHRQLHTNLDHSRRARKKGRPDGRSASPTDRHHKPPRRDRGSARRRGVAVVIVCGTGVALADNAQNVQRSSEIGIVNTGPSEWRVPRE